MAGSMIKDRQWVKKAFIVLQSDLDKYAQAKRYHSTANDKFTDTTPGGNFAINPLPQFTRYCDPRAPGFFSKNMQDPTGRRGRGMGTYYSEAIDDNQQLINIRAGVAQFNSLSTFFTGFYSSDAGALARTGRAPSVFYTLGKAAGFVVSIMSWKLLAITLVGTGLRYALQKPSSKFYYLKPTMPLYWNAVTSMVNQYAVNAGIVPRVGGSDQQSLNGNYEFTKEDLERMHRMMPDIFRANGGIDVYAMSTRAQRLAIKRNNWLKQAMNQLTNETLAQKLTRLYNKAIVDDRTVTFDSYLQRWSDTGAASVKNKDNTERDTSNEAIQVDANGNRVEDDGFLNFLDSELDDGSQFVTFRVNPTGTMSESWSSSVGESEIQNKINQISAQARQTKFNIANGNIGDGVVMGSIQAAVGAAKDFVSGVGASLNISGLATLGGAAFADIPKVWQGSSVQLTHTSYTIDLVSPYGNPISRLLDIYIPMFCLMALAMPLSTGKQSYTSPFLVELYDQGRCVTRLGMVTNMQATRGTGSLGWNAEGHALGVSISFTVEDMSTIMSMPISQGFSFGKLARGAVGAVLGTGGGAVAGGAAGGAAGFIGGGLAGGVVAGAPGAAGGAALGSTAGTAVGTVVGAGAGAVLGAGLAMGTFDDDNKFTEYMNTLAGMSLYDQIYVVPRAKLALTRQFEDARAWVSTAHIAQFMGDMLPGRIVSGLWQGTSRQ